MRKENLPVIVAQVEFVRGGHRREGCRQDVMSGQLLVQAFHAFRAEIHDGMLVILQILDLGHQCLRIRLHDFRRLQPPCPGIVFPVQGIVGQIGQVRVLVFLGIVRQFHQILRQISVTHRVGLYRGQHMFEQGQGSIEILVDAAQVNIHPVSGSHGII